MPKVITVALYVFVCFIIENVLSELFGRWFRPNILIILVVFFNLYRGIRYSLLTALLAGILKDSYGVHLFGLNIFSLILCAYSTTFIKMYIYQPGSDVSRVLIVFLVCVLNVIIQFLLHMMFVSIPFAEVFKYVFLPEVLTTLLVTTTVLRKLRQCASRSFA